VSDTTGTTNGPPTGVAVPDYSIQLPTSSQALSCGTVTDPNSDPIVYLWTKSGATCGSFSATNVAAPTMTGLTAGSCIVTCDASDPAGSNSHVTDSGTITVAAAGGGGTNWTADSKCRAFYNFENDGSPLADDCDDGGNSDDLSVLFGSAAYVTTDKPTGVGAAFRWFDCAGTSTLLSTSGTNASNRLQDNEFTIFAVLRTATDMTTQYYMGNWVTADSGNAGWRMHIDSLGRWRNYMTGPISAAVDPVASTIYTVSMSFHRNAVGEGTRFYVNGINDANYNQTTGGAGNVAAGDGELQVCGYDGAASFDGYISSILYLGGAGAYLDATESRDLCRFGPKGDWADRSTECD
jgi:hypothetical protein